MFTASLRLPLIAAIGCLALAACDQSSSPPAHAPQDAAPLEEPAQAAPAVDPAAQAGPTTLTEIDEASRTASMPASGMCNIDKINGEKAGAESPVRVQNASDFTVSGWVVERGSMTRPQAVLRLQEVNGGRAWEIGVGPGTSRGDVGRHLKVEGLRDAGFEVQMDLSAVPPGEYALSLNHYSGGHQFTCDKGARIIVGA